MRWSPLLTLPLLLVGCEVHRSSTSDWVQVSAGEGHACGLRDDGSVGCWGSRCEEHGNCDPPDTSLVQISAGDFHTCGLTDDGEVLCWGCEGTSGLGLFSYDVDFGQCDPPAGTFVEVSVGSTYTCALRDDGRVLCWGNNTHGRADPP